MSTQLFQPRIARTAARWVVLGIALAALTGCEQPRADVSGNVSYRGRPVVYGTVSIIGSDQATYYAVIQPDGTFTAPGVPVGPARVGVYSPNPYSELPLPPAVKAKIEQARRDSGVAVPPKPPKGRWVRLPAKYADPLGSGLTADLSGPTAVVELRLD